MQISVKRLNAMKDSLKDLRSEVESIKSENLRLRNRLIAALEASEIVKADIHKIKVNTALIRKDLENK